MGLRPHTAGSADEALETLKSAHGDLAIADFLTKPFQRGRFALAVDRGRL